MARKTSVDKTPIEKAIDAAVAAPVEEKKAPAKKACRTKAVKTVAAEAEVVKEEVAAPVEEKKAPAKKAAEKAPAKKATAAKKEMKYEVTVQYAGKSYTQDDLMKIAKDVWRFDLKQKAADLVSVELYVKPEENMVYYVFNGTECGSFAI
ncbi:MAG: DNA-binding protein [Lachnospiraceae bacterium]|nr:DNA-binding protein [Lachnospiraceae bacterium]